VSLDDTTRRAARIALRRFDDEDGIKAVEMDVTEHLTDAELVELFDSMETGEWAKVDRLLDAVEGRAPWPEDGVPDVTDSEHKAGGADRDRGGAEKLRRYWTVGEGGAKIRWGHGARTADFTRCVALLSKYMGNRAKGYCALRHKEMNGFYPGSKLNK
jgi:hypothetical protein